MNSATDCFGCGEGGESLRIQLRSASNGVDLAFTPRVVHAGLGDLVNGGVLATVLEEAGAAAASQYAPTGLVISNLSVRYLAPSEVGSDVSGHATVVSIDEQRIRTEMHLQNRDGVRIAEAEAVFVALDAEKFRAIAGIDIQDGPTCGTLLIDNAAAQ